MPWWISWKKLFPASKPKPSVPIMPNCLPIDLPILYNDDPLYWEAANTVVSHQNASPSFLQRRLKIGHNRACALIEALERDQIVTPMKPSGDRNVAASINFNHIIRLREEQARKEQTRIEKEKELLDMQEQRRYMELKEKYQDSEIAQKLLHQQWWQGMTEEQLIDCLGAPDDKHSEQLKTKFKEIWKYHPQGRNRYRLRFQLENGIVVAWSGPT